MATGQLIRIDAFNSLAEDMSAAIEAFLSYCQSKNLSNNTIIYYRYRLESFRRYIDKNAPGTTPLNLNAPLIRGFIADESKRSSPSTANHSVISLKAFFNYLIKDGFLDRSPMAGVEKLKQRKAIIQTFSLEQIEALLATCEKSFAGIRDRAIVLLLLDCGLRASELCDIKLDDVNWTEQTILICGKGDKERLISYGQTARSALSQYLARRGELNVRNLFVSCYAEPINRYRLLEMIKERCSAANISGLRCSPHTLRHTFAVHYLRNGGDVFSLQKILGHSDLAMTRRYVELSEMDVREKHRAYSPADRIRVASSSARRERLR
ncbi:MAG: tyrosine-type recombinase/integrase [Armatimonadota bacterium]|nr:tyrosine-type recombinase/integrase [bacterium]